MAARQGPGNERVVFVDESKTKDYLLVAVGLPRSELGDARRALRTLVLRGQNRLHMRKESDPRRRQILTTIIGLPLTEVLVVRAAKDGRSDVQRRADCIRRLVSEVGRTTPVDLCFELDETLLRQDRQHLVEGIHHLRHGGPIRHRHETAAQELLLAVPDAFAWAWAKGGDWRRRCGRDVEVIDV